MRPRAVAADIAAEQFVGDALEGAQIDPYRATHEVDGNRDTATVPHVNPAAPIDLAVALGTYLDAVDRAAPGLVEGLYVVGSGALDDWIPGLSDIDIIAVTAEPATDDDHRALVAAHADLVARQPLPHVDGVYLAWGDLSIEPATGLHRPWVFDGALRHDGDCPEINPITWCILAEHALVVRGPAPGDLDIATDMEARIRYVVDELSGYWRDVARGIADSGPDGNGWDAGSLEWCVLGSLRLHRTAFTGEVVSKTVAGRHGLTEMPEVFHDVIEHALRIRSTADRSSVVEGPEMATAAHMVEYVIDEVVAAAR